MGADQVPHIGMPSEDEPAGGRQHQPSDEQGRRRKSRMVTALKTHAVGLVFGLTAAGSVGTSLLPHLGPVVAPVSVGFAIAAAVEWNARTITHISAGRLRLFTSWTIAELVVAAAWLAGCALVLRDDSRVAAEWTLAAGTAASFLIAELSEIALTSENDRRQTRSEPLILTGREYFRELRTQRLTGQRVVDGFGPIGRAANATSRGWQFSGLVMSLLMFGCLSVAGLLGAGLDVFGGSAGPSPAQGVTTPNRLGSGASPTPSSAPSGTTLEPIESATATPLPAAPPVRLGTEKLDYDEACNSIASQEPGGDAPSWAMNAFSDLYFGPGEHYTGCAQPTRSNHHGTCLWEVGVLNGVAASVAVVSRRYGDALFYDGTAAPIIELLNAGYCIGGTNAKVEYSGDVQLVYSNFGTQTLLRATEYLPKGEAAPHLLLSPAMTQALLAAMRHFDEWLWPVSDGIPGEYRLVDTDLSPVGATVAADPNLGVDAVTITSKGFSPTFTGGRQIGWSAFADFAQ